MGLPPLSLSLRALAGSKGSRPSPPNLHLIAPNHPICQGAGSLDHTNKDYYFVCLGFNYPTFLPWSTHHFIDWSDWKENILYVQFVVSYTLAL